LNLKSEQSVGALHNLEFRVQMHLQQSSWVTERHIMTATYFKATHSNGTVHLRATNGTGAYKFAVVGPRASLNASFSSRRELAVRQLEKDLHHWSNLEVVPAIEIERAEYNALNSANKIKYAVTFRGKKHTTTSKIGAPMLTHAVGYFRPAQEVRIEILPSWHASWHEKHPEGFYMRKDREELHVSWFTREDWAMKTAKEYPEMGYEVELFTL
jgi:hypothetical protein